MVKYINIPYIEECLGLTSIALLVSTLFWGKDDLSSWMSFRVPIPRIGAEEQHLFFWDLRLRETGSAKNPTLAKGTFIFKSALGWQMLVRRRVRAAKYAHFAVQMLN